MRRLIGCGIFFVTAIGGLGQTKLDLRGQSKNVDFSAAATTKPAKTGSSLPATCLTGEVFFNTNAAPGANLYGCVATNTWAAIAEGTDFYEAGASGGIVFDRTGFPWTIDIDTAVICDRFNACAPTGAFDLSGSTLTKPSRVASSDPATCQEGESYYNTALHLRRDCTATNVWSDTGSSSLVTSSGLGYFLPWGFPVDTLNAAASLNQAVYYQVVLPYPMTVRNITMKTQGVASGKAVGVGIYDSGCNLVSNASGKAVGTIAAGVFSVALTAAVNLLPGIYHFGWATEDNTATFSAVDSGPAAAFFNPGSEARIFTGAGAVSGTGATYAMPSSCGAKTPGQLASVNFVWLP